MINTAIVMRGIFGNILLMIPLGTLIAMYETLRGINGRAFLALTFAFTVAAELLQFALRIGQFDIDTIMLRSVGVIIGYIAVRLASSLIARGRAEAAR